MLNTEDTGSMENLFEIRRYQIDIHNERVSKQNLAFPQKRAYIDLF